MQPEQGRIGYLLSRQSPLVIVVVIAACGWLLAKLLVKITGNLWLDEILGLLIILPPVVFFGYLFSLEQLSSRAASLRENGWLKYWIPSSLFLVTLVGVIYWLVYVVEQRAETAVIAIIAAITIGVVFPWLLPTVWIAIERTWWRILLGGSPIAPKLINDTLSDFELSISAREIDRKIPRQFAFLIALNARIFNFRNLHHGLIGEKDQKEKSLFKSTVDNLNEGWRSGLPPTILDEYIKFIERTSTAIDDDDYQEGLRGRCAVANVKYLLGNLKEAREHAEKNWDEAGDDFVLKWMASYAYFSTTLYSGEFKEAMRNMAIHWRAYYVDEDPDKVVEALRQLSNTTLNPLLFIPRNLILAAAFEGLPEYEKEYWPSEAAFNKYYFDGSGHRRRDALQMERDWLKSWYNQAKRACHKAKRLGVDTSISLDFTHACAGFYFTLLYLDSQDDDEQRVLGKEAEDAFKKIEATSPTASRYVKAGFYGIFKLVTEKPEEEKPEEEKPEEEKPEKERAITLLRRAAQYSAISGNRFNAVDCLFLCCHAVAAQRAGRGLELEGAYYLKKVKDLASQTDGSESRLYHQLASAAESEVNSTPSPSSSAGGNVSSMKRILRIFHERHHEETTAPARKVEEKPPLVTAIENLNDGWRSGMPQDILNEYIERIDKEIGIVNDHKLKLRGRCAVANVRFLSGHWEDARKRAEDNWKDAGDDSVLKWMASYTYFTTTTLLRDFETGMGRMADHWNRYYASIPEVEQWDLIERLHRWTLNPVLAMPRNLILAAAFKGSPEFEERYWPRGQYGGLTPNEQKSEVKWVECWYDQAKHACNEAKKLDVNATISLDCSHAYAGFYYTLLFLDSQAAGTSALSLDCHRRAREAFAAIVIDDKSPTASRYVRSGFYGIFRLVTGEDPKEGPDPEEALRHFREAARLSAASGNRFGVVDFLFKCCHAVAAQRVEYKKSEGYLQPEVKQYLDDDKQEWSAINVAERIGHYFYSGLYAAAASEVSRMRGDEGQAKRLGAEARNKLDQTGERILRIFKDDADSSTNGGGGETMKYKIALRKSEEGYSVSVPGLPGCWSQGASEEEAIENIRDAIREYLAAVGEIVEDAEVREVEVTV